MTIRTAEQLDDAMAGDLVWRKKEISAIKFVAETVGAERQPAMLRAGVAVLYAHWEGFVKTASASYVEFVSFQRLRYDQLAPEFVALAVRKLLRAASDSSRIGAHLAVTQFLLTGQSAQSSLPYKDVVRSEGNLSSRVLREIVDTLGLSFQFYEPKSNLIDETLLKSRNTIAHGEYLAFDLDRYLELSAEVVLLLDTFRNDVSNAAALQAYIRAA